MKQNYQTIDAAVTALAVPEGVSVALGEIVADVREGLLAMAVGTGLQVMDAMMNADVTAACGPKGKHDPNRAAVRHGSEQGSVTLGGRRLPVARPRMRATPIHAPSSRPPVQAIAHAVALTASERSTMETSIGSGVTTRCSANARLSEKLSMTGRC